ncbi:MAG: M48 family metalloprotease, partial [Acetobacteraceae bacterium]|nr:M48 family metalloprotease [Acetobacteraceae bacterium]
MLRVNGLYGHVRRNDLRSAAMFIGFLVAFQLVAAVALFLPLVVLDMRHAPFFFGFSGYAERYVPIVAAAGCALFLIRFRRHVASVRATAAFRYVDRRTDPRLVNIVETQAIAAGLPPPKVGLVDSPALNAFACGLSARSAVVVATRGLVETLEDDELAAVVAHEIAHIRNGDIRLMAAANVLMDNLEWLRRRNPLRIAGYGRAILAVLMPPFLLLCLAAGTVTAAAFTLARVSRLLISSSREVGADAEAARMTHDPA